MRAAASTLSSPARKLGLSLAVLLFSAAGAFAGPLQDMIDAAQEGSTIMPPAGVYVEHLTINKALILDGSKGVILDGGGTGTVVELAASGAEIKQLTIRNSGHLHNALDAGLRIKGNFNVIKDVRLENVLFGIDLHQANNNIIRRTDIDSNDFDLEMKGDSIRLWYSNNNTIEDNLIHDARDFSVWYSSENIIRKNRILHGRYGIHFMYAHRNKVLDNEIADCVVGVFLMYSNDVEVRHNKLLRAWGASGMGVGFKETSGAVIADNDIVGNAVGIYVDISPFDPEATNQFTTNRIAYNGIGVEFHTDWQGNIFKDNGFMSNFSQIVVRGGGTALREGWEGNYWDDFAGFDQDRDGKGDSPFEIYNYADRIWMEVPDAAFFRGSFALESLDFVERLAPFSQPLLLVKEPNPLMALPVVKADEKPKSALEMLQ